MQVSALLQPASATSPETMVKLRHDACHEVRGGKRELEGPPWVHKQRCSLCTCAEQPYQLGSCHAREPSWARAPVGGGGAGIQVSTCPEFRLLVKKSQPVSTAGQGHGCRGCSLLWRAGRSPGGLPTLWGFPGHWANVSHRQCSRVRTLVWCGTC